MLHLTPQPPVPTPADLLQGLNPQQSLAVSTTEGPLLIIAGAGSGKTRVLTVRMAYLLRMGVHPSHLLALTFTNKAAQEMRDRIGKLVGQSEARSLWAGTFHSVFARMLRSHADRLGYTNTFTIYDADDQVAAIKAVMQQLGINQQNLSPTAVRSRISGAKNAMVSWQEYERQAASISDKQTAQVFAEYERRLRLSNAMDFDDLLLNMIRLLEGHADVLEAYHDKFRYILVDEYQDTNRAQYRVVNLLAKKYRNICVVGDDAQSIYRWRGADIRNILDFERDYPEATVVRLEQNYRSTKVILAAADSVIRNNAKQLKKTLWTDNADGEKITLLACRDDREEADHIVRTIRNRMETRGFSFKDIAILYRTNAQSQALEDALRRANLPYHIVSGVSFYKRKEVKDTLAYLRLLVNPDDSESVLRVINEPIRGIGATTLKRLEAYAGEQRVSLFQVLQSIRSVPQIQSRIAAAIEDFVNLVDRHRALLQELAPASLAQQYLEATGLPRMYKDMNTEESLDRWNNIERVLDHIAEQQELDETLTLSTYLEQVSLVSEQDDPKLGTERVAMMTMHAAKGLEFPLVFIAGMEQGLFPLAKAETDPSEQEEERRLLYVGITRAERELVLSYAEKRFRFGELVYSRPSMFLSEIDPDTLSAAARPRLHSAPSIPTAPTAPAAPAAPRAVSATPRGARTGPKRSEYSQIPAPEPYGQTPEYALIRAGMRVKHPMFGVGTVLAVGGSGQTAKATVEFKGGQRKQLMLAYARLEVL